MKSIKSLLVLGAMAMASSMAWAQGTTSNANCVSALPTEASAQAYALTTPRGALLGLTEGTYSQYFQANSIPATSEANPFGLDNAQYQFLLFPVEGRTSGYYVYNVATNKFLGTRGTASTKSGYTTGVAPLSDTPDVYYIWKHGQTGQKDQGYSGKFYRQDWPWTIGAAVRTSGNWNTINMTHWNNGVGYDFGGTSEIDGGNAYAIVPAEEVSEEVYREAYYKAYGEYPTAPVGPSAEDIATLQNNIDAIKADFGKVGYPKTTLTEDIVVDKDNYTATLAAYNAYFTTSEVNMPEEGKAYNLLIRIPNGEKWYMYRNNDGQLTAAGTNEPVGNAAKFVASNVSGRTVTFAVEGEYMQWFCTEDTKCYNGNIKGLSASTNTATTLTIERASTGNYGSGNIEGVTNDQLIGNVQIKGAGKTGTWYYNFRTDGAFISQYAGDKFYDDNWDNGASSLWRTCFFELKETELIVKNAWTDLEETLAIADEYIVGEGYGEYTLAEGDWATAIANAEAELNTHTTEANAEALNTTITDYIAALTLNLPAAGSFVTLQNVHGTYLNGGATTAGVAARVAEPSLFYYDAEGHLIGYPGGYALNNGPADLLGASTATYELVKGTAKGKLAVKSNNKYLMDWADGRLNTFVSIESTCNFTIGKTTALPVHVGAATFATLYAPVALTIPAEVKAYTLTLDGIYLKAVAVENTIPANTAVVLEANEGDYDFVYTTGGTAGTNALQGTVAAIAKPENTLVLGLDSEDYVGFYSLDGANLGGFKAYYVSTFGESNLRISFGELTSIISAAQQNGDQAIFDLQGRRVVKAQNGLFIQNGKKVIR